MKFVNDSETSREAGESIVDTNALQMAVYNVLLNRPSTDEEVQDELAMNPSTQRPRRIELVERHLVRDSGKRRPTKSGRMAVIWEVGGQRAPAPVKQLSLLDRLRVLNGVKP